MKEYRSDEFNNSRLRPWVDRLLHFDFNIDHIQGAKMGLVDYIPCQPNQKAKVTNEYDKEFVVTTITRIHDAIAAINIKSAPLNCQSQHINAVNTTHCTRATDAQKNHSKLLSALNSRETQLLEFYSANAAQFYLLKSDNMSNTNKSPQTPSDTPGE